MRTIIFYLLLFSNTLLSAQNEIPTQFEATLNRENGEIFSFNEVGTEGLQKLGTIEKKVFKTPLTYVFFNKDGEKKGKAIVKSERTYFLDNENKILAFLTKKEDPLNTFFVLHDPRNKPLLKAKLNLWADEIVLINPDTEEEILVFSRSFFRTASKWEGQVIHREFLEKRVIPFYVLLLSLIVELDRKTTSTQSLW